MDWGQNRILKASKNSGFILSRRPKFTKFWFVYVLDPLYFPMHLPVVYVVFRSDDIRH